MKLFGMEDVWGNVEEFVDGIMTNTAGEILTTTDNFNEWGTDYINQGPGSTNYFRGFMSKPQGTSEKGFILKEKNGSETTYFSDNTSLSPNTIGSRSGYYSSHDSAGIFSLHLYYNKTEAFNKLSARLMYL